MKNEIMRLAEAMAVAMAGEKDAVALIEARAALEAAAEKLTAERDEYAACADTMAAAHKVERDDLSARYETASRLVTSLSDALAKALKERDALKAELARPESTAVSMMRAENAELTAQLETLQYEVDAIPAIKAERDALKAELARPESTVVSLMRAENAALKDAARLALDALERILYKDCGEPAFFEVREAMAALKAVL